MIHTIVAPVLPHFLLHESRFPRYHPHYHSVTTLMFPYRMQGVSISLATLALPLRLMYNVCTAVVQREFLSL